MNEQKQDVTQKPKKNYNNGFINFTAFESSFRSGIKLYRKR